MSPSSYLRSAAIGQHTDERPFGQTFTMVTCDPNVLVAPIHPKAMITILRPGVINAWLRGSYDEVVALQRPYDASAMTVRGHVFPTR